MLTLLVLPLRAQDYVGDASCSGCHANMPETGFFDAYMDSGHPWKIYHVEGSEPGADTWPHTPVPPLPVVEGVQLGWGDVEYVIGNFFWKTRFMDREGYIYTGDEGETTQWNLATEEWVNYHSGEVKPFNCGRCHTTGYDPEGDSQHGLEGIEGSWEQDGIRCEACHGPSSEHVSNPGTAPPGGKECSECHYRDSEFRMPWKSGFMKHHQQSEDLSHSPHTGLTCMTCHNPHRSTVYNDGGMISSCTTCHPGNQNNGYYIVDGMESQSCKDCHMPLMGKSAVTTSDYVGDVRGHLFHIMTDAVLAEDNVYEVEGNFFWNQDPDGDAFVTLDYACLGCHNLIGDGLTLQQAADYSADIHTAHASSVGRSEVVPRSIQIESVHPNPFNPSTTIRYSIDKPYIVTLKAYDMLGKEVKELYHGPRHAGSHEAVFSGENLASGVYLISLSGGQETVMAKAILIK